jgi:hypothetical protein
MSARYFAAGCFTSPPTLFVTIPGLAGRLRLILAGRYDPQAEEYVSTGLMLLLLLAGTILGLRVVLQRDVHRRLRLGWLLIIAALVSYATAEAIWFVQETLSG